MIDGPGRSGYAIARSYSKLDADIAAITAQLAPCRAHKTEDGLAYAKILLIVFAVAVFGLWLNHQMDVWGNPWAHARPPLLDRWAGETTTSGGTHLQLDLILTRAPRPLWPISDNSSSDDRDIDGTALLCDSTGRRQTYNIQGSVRDVNGRHALLTLQEPPREPPGIRFARLDLIWDGDQGLAASGWLQRLTPTGSYLSSTADPDIKRLITLALPTLGLHRTPVQRGACG